MALIKCPNCGKEMSERAAICPQCSMAMADIQSALNQSKSSAIPKVENDKVNLQLKEEQTALQKQVATLKEEAKRLQESLASGKRDLDALNSAKQQVEAEIAKNKASEDKLQNLQGEIDKLQQQASSLKEEVKQQKDLLASGQVALDKIKAQIEDAKKELKNKGRYSTGEKVVIWILCIAIAATLTWIASMIIAFYSR